MSALPAITVLNQLSHSQKQKIHVLTAACRQADSVSLSYPEEEEGCRHYLFIRTDGTISAALAIVPYEPGHVECCAFTHPEFRRQGYFSALFKRAKKDWKSCVFSFTVEESCADSCATLDALGARLESRELQMEYSFLPEQISHPPVLADPALRLNCEKKNTQDPSETDDMLWLLRNEAAQTAAGSCRTLFLTPDSVWLHHVEIAPDLRGQGLGTALIRLLLAKLAANGVRHVLLHVSEDNLPAVRLYRKTGFCITKTLSCYLC